MAKLLFLVHGIGSHPPGWSEGVQAKLDEAASQYAAFRGGAARFTQRVRITEIRYDGIFEEVVDQWETQAGELGKWAKKQGRALPKVVAWLNTTLPHEEAKNFFWSTAVDALLYRGFPLVRDRVRSAVMAQVVSALTKNMVGGAVEASVLAHSLGTAVMHDTLHKLGQAPFEGNESFTAKRFQFEHLFMLADVCVLGPAALRDVDALKSIVRPTFPGGAGKSYCQFFVNTWHEWDPFILCGRFKPTTFGDNYFEVGPLGHFKRANVHGFTHYLDHPAVHIPIINGTLGFRAITRKEEQDALANYPLIGSPECSAELQTLKDKAKEFEHVGDDLEDIVTKAAEFYAVAKRAAETCAGLAGRDLFS